MVKFVGACLGPHLVLASECQIDLICKINAGATIYIYFTLMRVKIDVMRDSIRQVGFMLCLSNGRYGKR